MADTTQGQSKQHIQINSKHQKLFWLVSRCFRKCPRICRTEIPGTPRGTHPSSPRKTRSKRQQGWSKKGDRTAHLRPLPLSHILESYETDGPFDSYKQFCASGSKKNAVENYSALRLESALNQAGPWICCTTKTCSTDIGANAVAFSPLRHLRAAESCYPLVRVFPAGALRLGFRLHRSTLL